MQEYVTIYGEHVFGEIVTVYSNTVIVRTAQGGHHMVHKDSTTEYKAKRGANRLKSAGFDLEGCQTLGGPTTKEIRKRRKI